MEAESIEQDEELAIRLAAVALKETAVGTGEDVPIDMAKVVTFCVGAILGKFLGEAKVGGTVEAGHESINDGLGDEIEARDGGESGGVEEALEHSISPPRRRDAEF